MNLDKLEKLALLVLAELPKTTTSLKYLPGNYAKFNNLMAVSNETLPEYSELFNSSSQNSPDMNGYKAISVVEHLLKIIKLEKETNSK
jgi:hypothetical protein